MMNNKINQEPILFTKYKIYRDFIHNDFSIINRYFVPSKKLGFNILDNKLQVFKLDKLVPCKQNNEFIPNPDLTEIQLEKLKKSHPNLFKQNPNIDIIHESSIDQDVSELLNEILILEEKKELLSVNALKKLDSLI